VVNAGSIAGTGLDGIGVSLNAGGAVTNLASGSITGFDLGVYLAAGGTLTNAGTIFSNINTAVSFGGTGSNRLVLDPGFALYGLADGGDNASSSTLELASGASTGTLGEIGTKFIDFTQVTIDRGARWQLTGTNTVTADTAITNTGLLTLAGATLTADGALTNNGGIVLDPSTMTVGSLIGTGSVTIDVGGTLEVTGSIASTETIVFSGRGAYLHLDNPANAAGSVTGFGPSQTIDLKGITASAVSYASGQLTFGSGESFPLTITNGQTLQIATSTDGTDLTTLCFCIGTLIQTPRGQVKVQDLAVGDLVTTLRGAARPITWIGIGAVLATRGRRTAATPVIVRKSALADNVPFRDLLVTKGHSFLIDNVLIPVEFLVNHRSIFWDDRAQEVRLYHIELATHDVLLANGAPAESYRDDGNRWLFRNANSGWGQPPQEPCAPVLTGGPIVDAAWRRLLDRAGPRPGLPLTDDPDLHVLVAGKRLNVSARCGTAHIFHLPAERPAVRVVSRAGAPAELGLARDPRVLGVGIRRIAVRQGTRFRVIEATDSALAEGFHAFEPENGLRWTNGNAALSSVLFEGFEGPVELVLHVGCTTHYPLVAEAAGRAAA